MAQTVTHLVDRVFPDVDVRQWVLSVPKPLRLAMAMNADLCRDAGGAHIRVAVRYPCSCQLVHWMRTKFSVFIAM